MWFEFGKCRLDVGEHRLLFEGKEVPFSPKAFGVLQLLLSRSPDAVSKSELFTEVWGPNTFVEDPLAKVINEIRKAIGDDAHHQKFVRTIHTFGYAFNGTAVRRSETDSTVPTTSARYWVELGSKEFPLHDGTNVIGRDPASDVFLQGRKVSRRHAQIVVSADRAMLEDLKSTHGTNTKGRPVLSATLLKEGDQIEIGEFRLRFRVVRRTDLSITR